MTTPRATDRRWRLCIASSLEEMRLAHGMNGVASWRLRSTSVHVYACSYKMHEYVDDHRRQQPVGGISWSSPRTWESSSSSDPYVGWHTSPRGSRRDDVLACLSKLVKNLAFSIPPPTRVPAATWALNRIHPKVIFSPVSEIQSHVRISDPRSTPCTH